MVKKTVQRVLSLALALTLALGGLNLPVLAAGVHTIKDSALSEAQLAYLEQQLSSIPINVSLDEAQAALANSADIKRFALGDPVLILSSDPGFAEVGTTITFSFIAELSANLSGVGQLRLKRNSSGEEVTLEPTISSDDYSQFVRYTYLLTEADLCLDDPSTLGDERGDNLNVTLISIEGANLNNEQNEPVDLSLAGFKHLNVAPVLGMATTNQAEYMGNEAVTVTIPVTNGDVVHRSVSWARLDQVYVSLDSGATFHVGSYSSAEQAITVTLTAPANPGKTGVEHTLHVYTKYGDDPHAPVSGNTAVFTVRGSDDAVTPATKMEIGGIPEYNVIYLDGIPGDDGALTVNISPSNATFKTYTWTSSDESVAQISQAGVITAHGPGVVSFTLTSGELSWRRENGHIEGVDYDLKTLEQKVTLTVRSGDTGFEASNVTVAHGSAPTVYWMWDGSYPQGARDFTVNVYKGDVVSGEPVWTQVTELTGVEASWDSERMNWYFSSPSLSQTISELALTETGTYTYTVSTKNVNYPAVAGDVTCTGKITVIAPSPFVVYSSRRDEQTVFATDGAPSLELGCGYTLGGLYNSGGEKPTITVTVRKNGSDVGQQVYSNKNGSLQALSGYSYDISPNEQNYVASLGFKVPMDAPEPAKYNYYTVTLTVENHGQSQTASTTWACYVMGDYFPSVTLINSAGAGRVVENGDATVALDNTSKLGQKSNEELLAAYDELNFYHNMRLDVVAELDPLAPHIPYTPLRGIIGPDVVRTWTIYDNQQGGAEIGERELSRFIAPLDIPQNADWTVRVGTRDGSEQRLRIVTKSLKDKAYFFSVGAANTEFTIQYTNGAGTAKSEVLTSSAIGRIAIYEETGIASDVFIFKGDVNTGGEQAGESVGFIAKGDLKSGESSTGVGFNPALAGVDVSIASKLLPYPVNAVSMSTVSVARLFLKNLDGTPAGYDRVTVNAAIVDKNFQTKYGPLEMFAGTENSIPVAPDGQIAVQFTENIAQTFAKWKIDGQAQAQMLLLLEIVPPASSGDEAFLLTLPLDRFLGGRLKGADTPVHFLSDEQVSHIQRAYNKIDKTLVSEQNLSWTDVNEVFYFEKNYDTHWQFIVRGDMQTPIERPQICRYAWGEIFPLYIDELLTISLKTDRSMSFLSQDYYIAEYYMNTGPYIDWNTAIYFAWSPEIRQSTPLADVSAKRIPVFQGIMSDDELLSIAMSDYAKVPQFSADALADQVNDEGMRKAFEEFAFEVPTTLPFTFDIERSGDEYLLRGVVAVNLLPGGTVMDAAIDLGQGFSEIFNTVVGEVYGAGRGDAHNESITVGYVGFGNSAFVGVRGFIEGKGVYNPSTQTMDFSINGGGLTLETSASYTHYAPFMFAEMEITVNGELSSTFSIRTPSKSDLTSATSALAADFWNEQKIEMGVKVRAGVGYNLLCIGGYVGVQGRASASAEAGNVVRNYLPQGNPRRNQTGVRITADAALGIYARGVLGPITVTWDKDLWVYSDTALDPSNVKNPYYSGARMTSARALALSGYALRNETPLVNGVTDFANAQYSADGKLIGYTDVAEGKVLYSADGGTTFSPIEDLGTPAYSLDLSGTEAFAAAAWETLPAGNVLQEPHANAGNLGAVLGQSDIRAGVYDGSWQLTTLASGNGLADLSPKTAVNGSTAVAVWKQGSIGELKFSETGEVPLEGALVFKRYVSGAWENDAKTILPLAGKSQAVSFDAAVGEDGTIVVAISMEPTEDGGAGIIKYAVINAAGEVTLSDMGACGTNAQVVYADNGGGNKGFLIAYYAQEGGVRLVMLDAAGVEQSASPQGYAMGSNFTFAVAPAGSALSDFGLMWTEINMDTGSTALYAVKFCGPDGSISAPRLMGETSEGVAIASHHGYMEGNVATAAVNYAQVEFAPDRSVTRVNASIYKKSATFDNTFALSKASYNDGDIQPGQALPISFELTNTGISPIVSAVITIGGVQTLIDNLNIVPNGAQTLNAVYTVPEADLSAVAYSVAPTFASGASPLQAGGTIDLARLDVGVQKLAINPGEGVSDVILRVYNASGVPLKAGDELKLAFYNDMAQEDTNGVPPAVTLSSAADLKLVNEGGYMAKVQMNNAKAGPVTLFAAVTVETGAPDLNQANNVAPLTLHPPVSGNQQQVGGGGSSSGVSASLSTPAVTYDARTGGDITVTLKSGDYALSAIKNGNVTLVKGTDYTVSGDRVTIKAEYLETLAQGQHQLTFRMSGGQNPVLTITITGSGALAEWKNPFIDVKEGSWYYDDVAYASLNGLFVGTSENRFSPEAAMSRGMLVTVLWRLAGAPALEQAGEVFADVAPGSYYEAAIAWALKEGIVTGYGEGLFGPDEPVTREQFATILYRYAGAPARSADLLKFADAQAVSGWAHDAIVWATEEGIISGRPGGIIDPRNKATRAEAAAMLRRFLEQ